MPFEQTLEAITTFLLQLLLAVAFTGIFIAILAAIGFLVVLWVKGKKRGKKALELVLLQIALPRENEIKIDAAEQMFASLASLGGKSGILGFLQPPNWLSFEIVATPGSIRFYVAVQKKLQDLIEK